MQSVIYMLFLIQHKELPFLAVLTWFPILGKIQDGDHCWWRHRPPGAPPPIKKNSSCWVDQRLSTAVKIVSKYRKLSKTLERGSIFVAVICFKAEGKKLKRNYYDDGNYYCHQYYDYYNAIFTYQIISCWLTQVTREKGQSSVLLFSQFRESKEILINNVKFFPHENCLSFP